MVVYLCTSYRRLHAKLSLTSFPTTYILCVFNVLQHIHVFSYQVITTAIFTHFDAHYVKKDPNVTSSLYCCMEKRCLELSVPKRIHSTIHESSNPVKTRSVTGPQTHDSRKIVFNFDLYVFDNL